MFRARTEYTHPVTEEMPCPLGVAVLDGDLYVAQMHRLLRYRNIKDRVQPEVVLGTESPEGAGNGFPDTFWHGWRYVVADERRGKLLVGIGAPCNVPGFGETLASTGDQDCADNEAHPLLGTLVQLDPNDKSRNGSPNIEVIARGIRNSVGITVHPHTQDIWFTDNGRDQWGGEGALPTEKTDSLPPDELNVLGVADPAHPIHFGFPACYGIGIVDPTSDKDGRPFNPKGNCEGHVPATVEMPPHSASLGVRFYNESAFPREYHGAALIAMVGSWDKGNPSGYAVAAVPFHPNGSHKALGPHRELLGGFITDPPTPCTIDDDCPGNATCQTKSPAATLGGTLLCGGRGRPADVEVLRSGEVLVTDETNSLVYSVRYTGKTPDCITSFGNCRGTSTRFNALASARAVSSAAPMAAWIVPLLAPILFVGLSHCRRAYKRGTLRERAQRWWAGDSPLVSRVHLGSC